MSRLKYKVIPGQKMCPRCAGWGFVSGSLECRHCGQRDMNCPDCNGSGWITKKAKGAKP